MRAYYFGCVEQAGHYMHTPDLRHDWEFMRTNPWGNKIDGGLVPKREGRFAITRKDGWTALAFVDNTVDSRPGSNSAFLAEGDFDLDQMLAIAKEQFPAIWKRCGLPEPPTGEQR